MKIRHLLPFLLVMVADCRAYEIPRPLTGVKAQATVTSTDDGVFSYKYMIVNPSNNNGSIASFYMFIDQDPSADKVSSTDGLSQCPKFFRVSSQRAQKERPMTPVGSTAPDNWTCGFSRLALSNKGSFGWSAMQDGAMIQPGKSLKGFSLISRGLPAIRDIIIEPDLDSDQLPDEYEGDVGKTVALEKTLRWTGKTIGPRDPPHVFIKESFIEYFTSLKEQSVALGWITGSEVDKELSAAFAKLKTKLATCDRSELKEAMSEVVKVSQRFEGKGITAEGLALLVFNAKYFNSTLPALSTAEKQACKAR